MECADLVLLIEGSEFAFKNCVSLRCIQGHVNYMILDAPQIHISFEDKFGTLN